MKTSKRVTIIGAGPSGLSVAWGLAENQDYEVSILEATTEIGGLSKTLEYAGIRFDIGPHRLSAQLPEMLEAVRGLLGDQLIEKENHHAVYFDGNLYRYPPRLRDFLNFASLKNTLWFGGSWIIARLKSALTRFSPRHDWTFEEVLLNGFGKNFCTAVIFPMIKKVWGTSDLHADFARIRFKLPTVSSFIFRIFSKRAKLNSRYFYYPLGGFGEIWKQVGVHLLRQGHKIELSARITRIEAETLNGPFTIHYTNQQDKEETLEVDTLVSTVSNQDLLEYLQGIAEVVSIMPEINHFDSRTLRLGVILVRDYHLPTRVVIFPEQSHIFNRISEMNQFSDLGYPEGLSVLMVDVIMDKQSPYHEMHEDEFNRRLKEAVLMLGWFKEQDITQTFSIKIPNAYPVLDRRRYDAQERLSSFFAGTGIILCGREASTDYNNAHNAIAKGFLAAQLIQGNIPYAEYSESSKIIGRLPIQD
jgi:protoporphyrinogen oxidase